ncbi:glutaredoxin-related protein 5, mitochondrial-like [Bombina bombina]|uniref:glutaredoxin-related protein 5, mitochondrial-like n=1 Tax=Bombina bombina TaxID=8345 RepID=UPI00235A5BB7|nr:glutaredoxin-related protein 5, mitochondrial-like [Bombina bombina]
MSASLYRLSATLLCRGNNQGTAADVFGRRWGSQNTSSWEHLASLVKKDKVVVFIKGTPAQPMCGFNNAVVQILWMHGVEYYAAYNVLEDQDLRQGIKNYAICPTIAQVYLNGEFVGGCDILLQMHQNGVLVDELKKLGVRSALLEEETIQEKK